MTPRDQRVWWRDAVTYQIYIRSFADGNGDGIGDIEGIRSKLPYLKSLGVDAIWITPWYPSPQNDHGYDVANYMDIEPMYGTLEDAERLIAVMILSNFSSDTFFPIYFFVAYRHCNISTNSIFTTIYFINFILFQYPRKALLYIS